MKDILEAMKAGETVFGVACNIQDTASVQILGLTGWDFVIINTEGGTSSIFGRELERLLLAARAADVYPVVKIPRNDPAYIASALNQGGRLLEVPDVRNADDARRAVMAAKFAPEGERNVGWGVPAGRYGIDTLAEFTSRANAETGVYAVLEHPEALENIDEIASVNGVDVISIGKADTELRLGGIDDPRAGRLIADHRARLAEAVRRHDKAMLMAVTDMDAARRARELGVKMFLWGKDDGVMLGEASRRASGALREAVART